MTVVQADGQNVQPVEVDEFRIGPAETYDVIVEPTEDRAYTIFAEVARSQRLCARHARSAPRDERGDSRTPPAPATHHAKHGHEHGRHGHEQHEARDGGKCQGRWKDGARHGDGSGGHDMKMPGKAPASEHEGHDMKAAQEAGARQTCRHDMPKTPRQPAQHEHHAMTNMAGMDHRAEIPGSEPVKHGPDSHGSGNQTIPDCHARPPG